MDQNEKFVKEEEEKEEEKPLVPLFDAHKKFILSLDDHKDSFEYHVMEHLRMSGVYWGCTAMYLLGELDGMKGDEIIEWIKKCEHQDGALNVLSLRSLHLFFHCLCKIPYHTLINFSQSQ
jgi:prenyltransferase beta subunit